ncbi:trigger factor [Helicobacter enhydrae]|uniref:Trigger factor n=1 Tax=Helicobacter enhydrae TaxID=222136 RepID=A0A1B1U5V3_9HELI|nr:trigger factor [Helicobacter enhydrae]ANV98139.1 trigger factor [Helicobacter enhydrae]
MSLKVERINEANAIASGVIPSQVVDKKYEEICKKYTKLVSVSGFRKGKVPLSMVKQRFGAQIQQDVEQEVVRASFQDVLKELEVNEDKILGNPSITKFEKVNQDINVEFKMSIAPKIDLSKLKSCVPSVKIKAPSLKEIDERLDEIAKHNAPLVEAKSSVKLAKDHTANIDFEGFVDGKAFDGGKAEGFDLLIGSGQFIAGFEDQLIGMKKGEEKDIEVTFPKEYPAKDLADKPAVFKVKLNAIKTKDAVVLDDALAQKLLQQEDATLSKLKEEIKQQLINEAKQQAYNQELKPKLVEKILETIHFDLPDLIVEQEMNILLNNYARTLSQEELEAFQKDSKAIESKRKEFEEEAQKSVKMTFIVDLATREFGLQIQDNEVMQTIYYEAMMSGQNPKQILEFYQKNNLLPAVKMAMLQDRFLVMLLDEKYALSVSQETAESQPAKSTEKKPKTKSSTSTTQKAKATKEK